MNNIKAVMIIILSLCILLPWSLYAGNYNKEALPCAFGPFYLGMTEKEFTKITGLESYYCEGCGIDEYTAAVDINRYPGTYPKYIYSLKADQRGIDCYFYKKNCIKLYCPLSSQKLMMPGKNITNYLVRRRNRRIGKMECLG
jgi:hypothetical protein